MSTVHAPGPWTVQKLSKPQARPYYVVRSVEDGTWSSPHWEQLRHPDGGIAGFETHAEASAAISAGWASAVNPMNY